MLFHVAEHAPFIANKLRCLVKNNLSRPTTLFLKIFCFTVGTKFRITAVSYRCCRLAMWIGLFPTMVYGEHPEYVNYFYFPDQKSAVEKCSSTEMYWTCGSCGGAYGPPYTPPEVRWYGGHWYHNFYNRDLRIICYYVYPVRPCPFGQTFSGPPPGSCKANDGPEQKTYIIKLFGGAGSLSSGSLAETEPGKTINLVAYVYDQNNQLVSGAGVKLEIDVVANSGGHQHHDDSRPKGILNGGQSAGPNSITGSTGSGSFDFSFNAPAVAGDHKLKASCTDRTCKQEGPDTVWVGVKDLVPLGVSQYFVPVGDTPNHFDNHYLTLEAASRVNVLAALCRAKFPNNPLLHLNDASLERGGVFDVSSNWQSPHFEHCKGTTIDVRANDALGAIPPQNQLVFEELAQKVGAKAKFEIPEDRNGNQLYHLRHYHVQLMGSEGLTCK